MLTGEENLLSLEKSEPLQFHQDLRQSGKEVTDKKGWGIGEIVIDSYLQNITRQNKVNSLQSFLAFF